MPVSVKPSAFAIAALVLVFALWHVFRPQAPERQAPASAAGNAASRKDVFDLVIKDGKLASGQSVMQVHQGEQVVLRISSNTSDELHLHGYDLHAQLTPQETAVLEFNANRTGRFTLELHQANTELGALEVYPP
jgi:hypothetical protein